MAAALRKSVADRYFDIYQEGKVNGLHLVAFWYGDGDKTGDSDTFMQSTTNNRDGQLFAMENSSGKMLQETIDSSTWSKQYPEGYFAHLHSQLGVKLKMLELERVQTNAIVQTWEDWGWKLFYYDSNLTRKNVWIDGKKLRNILTEQQKTELKDRLIHYHGKERNGKIVVKDWYDPWMSREADEYANYILLGWRR